MLHLKTALTFFQYFPEHVVNLFCQYFQIDGIKVTQKVVRVTWKSKKANHKDYVVCGVNNTANVRAHGVGTLGEET